MRTFLDAKKRRYTLDLTVGTVRRIKASLGVDLTAPQATTDSAGKPDPVGEMILAQRIAQDVMLAVDVIFAAVESQAATHGVDVDEFCHQLPPGLCRLAREALQQEWEDFFRELGRDDQAAIVRGAVELQAEIEAETLRGSKILEEAARNQMRTQMTATLNQVLSNLTPGNSSTNSPESSDSTPNP